MRRTSERKVQYGFHNTEQRKPHPEIKIGGRYLETAGFHIGDTVIVYVTHNEILIRKSDKAETED